MSAVATAIAGSAIVGAVASRRASNTAQQTAQEQANVARETAQRAEDVQREMFERQVQLQEPWRRAGISALNQLAPLASQYTPFGMQQFQAEPGYQFRLGEGIKALERSAAARGGLLSGATLKGIQRYGQDLASQEYQNAFNRYQAERQARLGPLQSLAGVGQTSSNALAGAAGQLGANLGQTYGTMGANVANALGAGGAARASGYIGGANALTGALGTGLNYYQNQQFLNARYPQATSANWDTGPALVG